MTFDIVITGLFSHCNWFCIENIKCVSVVDKIEERSSIWSFIRSSKYMFHIFTFIYSSFTGILRTHNMRPAPSWLDSSVGRALLHRNRRGHGFESRFKPEFFQAFLNRRRKMIRWHLHHDFYFAFIMIVTISNTVINVHQYSHQHQSSIALPFLIDKYFS